jgi:hypothetical protein
LLFSFAKGFYPKGLKNVPVGIIKKGALAGVGGTVILV